MTGFGSGSGSQVFMFCCGGENETPPCMQAAHRRGGFSSACPWLSPVCRRGLDKVLRLVETMMGVLGRGEYSHVTTLKLRAQLYASTKPDFLAPPRRLWGQPARMKPSTRKPAENISKGCCVGDSPSAIGRGGSRFTKFYSIGEKKDSSAIRIR
eukprot:CAMPEP_0113955874 /NCGR_PEP_ID=MMETSP0011_2-20120614/1678_1 /TAXON_ID=101924 /ORGANISM="Rhodosorus marinus" /LENGTH=153 /DNA_ID=CAMNT_0000965817 /DNA_START=131 /DNA_END=592 /DNA_ORIENTATION=+ /assembly_acc=CAM_ASM_000156